MTVAINALLDRLPNLRLDPDAEPPRFIGFYERGATAIPVRLRLTPRTRGATLSEETYQPPDLMLLGEEHVQRYQETDGEVGYLWNGVPTLLLTTTGPQERASRGRPRSSSAATATTIWWSPPWAGPRNIPTGTGT